MKKKKPKNQKTDPTHLMQDKSISTPYSVTYNLLSGIGVLGNKILKITIFSDYVLKFISI